MAEKVTSPQTKSPQSLSPATPEVSALARQPPTELRRPSIEGRHARFSEDDLDRLQSELRGLQKARSGQQAVHGELQQPAILGPRVSMLAHALSGAMSSVLAELILFPLDTIKLLAQTADAKDSTNFVGYVFRILRERGVAGFYRGLGTSMLKEGVHSFNFWCWHTTIFRLFSAGDNSRTSVYQRLLLNLVSKQCNWLCTVPFEVVASVNQLDPKSPGFIATAAKLYREGGVRYFYRGLPLSLTLAINPAVMNTLITSFLRIAAGVKMLVWRMDHDEARDHSSGLVGAATALAKLIATVITYPLIRAKVLQQSTVGRKNQAPLEVLREIIAIEGVVGLYRGLLPMSYKTVMWNCLMMTIKNGVGPRRAVTPPISPTSTDTRMPWMGRDAFVDDVIAEKMDEILRILQRNGTPDFVDVRVKAMEAKLLGVNDDMREIKAMLRQLVTSTKAADGDALGAST